MADEVVISNLALSFLGDEATISGISPPEGSTQAEHCAQFFPIARRALLEMHPWDFATKSVALAQQDETIRGWQYAYAKPSNCLKVWTVLPPNATDDHNLIGINRGVIQAADGTITVPIVAGTTGYAGQRFKTETSYSTGTQLILTNQAEAEAICTFDVTDTTLFTPLFDLCLAKLLAAFIAGPIYKGKTGVQMHDLMTKHFEVYFARAAGSNSDQEYTDVQVSVPWIAGR
ncbi:MAG: hypothetical protein IT558_00750 [Alphaproteobacteria bacterium]|nr:hypothetical protein [Alphaproteobacteria bacterium]